MNWGDLVLVAHAGATLAMAGLIWFVQIVHYPLFDRVSRDGYPGFQRQHERLTARVVAPLMLIEALTAALLLWQCPAAVDPALPWVGAALLLVIWLSTALVQVPEHRRLEAGFDAAAHRRLVATNWLRTSAWSARGAIALIMIGERIGR